MPVRKIPITYRDNEDNLQQTAVVFDLPIKSGDTSLGVQMIKYFLGLGDLATTNSEFDAVTQNAVVGFQEDNRQRIYEIGEYGFSSDALVDQVRDSEGGTEGDVAIAEELIGGASFNVDLPGGFMTERGQIGEPTFRVMMELGLKTAVAELASSSAFQNLLRSGQDVNPNDAFNTVTGEQEPPTFSSDGKFVRYNYITNVTRQTIKTEGFDDALVYFEERRDVLQRLFREAVIRVFEYYGKEKVWVVDGAERTFIPIVSPLQDVIDDPDLPRKLYEEILVYQNRVGATAGEGFGNNQRFKFTINPMSLDEQLNGDKVDVLFGQSLQFGAVPKFAAIRDVQEPGARPNSPYIIKIEIRKDMFNQIRGGSGAADFGGTVDVTDPENWKKAKAGFDAAKDFVQNDLKKPFSHDFWKRQGNSIKSGAQKWAKGKQMEAEQAAKDSLRNAWNKARTGQAGGSQKRRDEATEEALNAAKEMGNNLVSPATYDLTNLNGYMTELAEGIASFTEDIRKFEEENKPQPRNNKPYNRFQNNPPKPPIVPAINPDLESKRLLDLINVIEGFLDKNGFTMKVGPNSKDQLMIYFDKVEQEVEVPVKIDASEQPAIETPQQPKVSEKILKVVGHKIYKMVYVTDGVFEQGKVRELNAGTNDFTSMSPFIFPSTMSYLNALANNPDPDKAKVPEILSYVRPNPCNELEKIPAVLFFGRFHFPSPDFVFRKGKKIGINIGLDFNARGIKTVKEHIKEQRKLAETSIDNLLESTFFEQKGKVIRTADVYPKFGELACNIEDMWNQFLNKWDPQLILCDYKKCVPGLEDLEFSLDFKWNIPTLPRLPTFNPFHFVLPQLKISLADLIMQFICEMIKSILEAISYPDCVDALQYGAALMSQINEKNKDNPFANAQQKADLATKTSEVLNNMGIPQDVLFGESESSIEALFDAISLVLRPAELCDLLEGTASSGVLRVVFNVVRSSNSRLKSQLETLAQISEFFRVLGQVVDPYLCDRLREISEVVVADALCSDRSGLSGLRERLEEAGISSDEIARQMKAAERRRDALRKIANDGNFDSLLPGNLPSDLESLGMPGPYNNPHHDRVAEIGLKSILSNIKRVFNLEVVGFPEIMVDRNTSLIRPGQVGFNEKDFLYFSYYSGQVQKLENNLPAMKAGPFRPMPSRLLEFIPYHMEIKEALESQGLTEEEYTKLNYFIKESDEVLFDPNETPNDETAEKAEEFSDLIEQYVSEYVNKYTVENPIVYPEFREIVAQDLTTVTRKTTATTGSPYRELHVRVFNEKLRGNENENIIGQPVNIDSKSNVVSRMSAGYSEMPFISSQVKDCYRVSYAVRTASSNWESVFFNKVYRDELPSEYINKRKQSADVTSDLHVDKLLRPGGFADIYIEGLKKISNNASISDIDVYEEESLRNHISGFILGSGGLRLDANDDGEITGTERLVYLLNLIAQTAATRQDGFSIYEGFSDSFNYHISNLVKNSRFFDYDEMFQLQRDISKEYNVKPSLDGKPCYVPNPKLLDFEEIVQEFLNSYKQETEKPENDPQFRDFSEPGPFQTSTASGLFGLYVKFTCLEIIFKSMFLFSNFGPKGVFTTQFMIDYVVNYIVDDIQNILTTDSLRNQVMKVVKETTKIDDEDQALRALILRNIDTSSIEKFIAEMFESKYLSFADRVRNEIAENAKEVPSVDNYPKIIVRETQGLFEGANELNRSDLEGLIDQERQFGESDPFADERERQAQLFALDARQRLITGAPQWLGLLPVHRSEPTAIPRESYRLSQEYRQLQREIDDLNDTGGALRLTGLDLLDQFVNRRRAIGQVVNDLNGFKQIPVSAIIPNIYESFAFEGYSDELIQKKINSGHFWMEKFYRIKNFPEFFRIYSEIYNAVQSDPLFRNMASIGDTATRSLYSEYISPSDLERLLLGTENTDTRQELLEVLAENEERTEIEYDFVKEFYLKCLMNFFSGRVSREFEDDYGGPDARRAWHAIRLRKSSVVSLMIDIGMADKVPENIPLFATPVNMDIPESANPRAYNGEAIRKIVFGFAAYPRSNGSNWGDTRVEDHAALSTDLSTEAPTSDILSELDYAYRSGKVSKQELIERTYQIMYQLLGNEMLDDTFQGDTELIINWDRNIQQDPFMMANSESRSVHSLSATPTEDFAEYFGTTRNKHKWLARNFLFDNQQYEDTPGYKFRRIPLRRKAELVVNCLTNMLDIIHNWPLNLPFESQFHEQLRTKVWWRQDPLVESNLYYSRNERILFRDISRSKRSVDYLRRWNSRNRGDPVYSMNLDPASQLGTPLDDPTGIEEARGTPFFTGESPMQSAVLDYYISRAYVPIVDERELSATRTSSGALTIMKPLDWDALASVSPYSDQPVIPVNETYTNVIVPKQQELYDFLKNNLQIGARLMMGQKVRRTYEKPATPVEVGAASELTTTGIMETLPTDIFEDFNQRFDYTISRDPTGELNTIGLESDPSLFNRKKCFLAYADKHPLNSEQNPSTLDHRSSFYNVASLVGSSIGLGGARYIDTIPTPVFDDGIVDSLVYSVPVHEYLTDVGCLDDVYASQHETPFYPFEREEDQTSGQSRSETEFLGLETRRTLIKSGIYEMKEQEIVSSLLALGEKDPDLNTRTINDSDPNHPANVMFKILFPLERYTGIHTLQGNMVFDKTREEDGILTATKLMCLASMETVGSAHDITQPLSPQLDVDESALELSGFTLGDLWRMFYRMLQKLLEQAYGRVARTFGEKADPGYRDMMKTYKKDPCEMKTGLQTELLGGPIVFERYDGDLQDGFGMKNGEKEYVSVNNLPIDIIASAFNPSQAPKVAKHLKGLITGNGPRYGYPIGVFGRIALSSPQLTSELLSNMKDKKQCENPGQEEPQGLCEDKEGGETE